ncbi:mucolipin-3-like isoform X2 [Cimex lectularius]|nr:mucolipin-3-like isoform X2 [Cimex lectularius]XP_014243558.1 mucolipin-3-like isoform X2 [Cimex lectularius]
MGGFDNPSSSAIEDEPLDIKCYEAKLRKKLKFFFMNPIEKWKTKRRFPYKFLVQIIKIALVTIQISLFAHTRYNYVNYAWNNRITFSNLFLMGWDSVREVYSYPPSIGPLAIYKQIDFYKAINHALSGYKNINGTIGPYSYANENNYMTPPSLCVYQYKKGYIFGFNESYVFNNEVVKECCQVSLNRSHIEQDICIDKSKIEFSALVKATLDFPLKTVNFNVAGLLSQPDCYQFNITIVLDNAGMDGQMVLSLDTEPIRLQCKGNVEYITNNTIIAIITTTLNVSVILICALSFVLCVRAIARAQQLKQETVNFFLQYNQRDLSLEGRWEFWNLWYIMIIINDILIIIGSCIKEEIERKQVVGDQWNTCSVCLGTGNLLVWFGVLRYLGFFKTYNVVILTLKKAFPKVIRFLLCALLIYAGFTFCGWLVLGPYHIKFRTLASTSECLFSLINGDDMFATFSIITVKSTTLWWYSRIYLYSFISLYIYVVLSLFISIIMDAYETIKLYYKEGFPKNDLQIFMSERAEEIFFEREDLFPRPQRRNNIRSIVRGLCCCNIAWKTLSKGQPCKIEDNTNFWPFCTEGSKNILTAHNGMHLDVNPMRHLSSCSPSTVIQLDKT